MKHDRTFRAKHRVSPVRTLALALILGLVAVTNMQAQVISAIAFNQRMSTYTPITGTVLGASTGYADDESYVLTLPFAFKFNNKFYTTVYPSTNGYITLGYGDPYLYPYPIAYTWPPVEGVICPWGGDLYGNYSGEMSYLVTGSAPNRMCTIQWKNWHYWGNSTASTMNFQVRLYETTGLIEFVYGSCSSSFPQWWYGANVGLTSDGYDYQTRETLPGGDWLASTPGTDQYGSCWFDSQTIPQNGLLYRWGCYIPEDQIEFDVVNEDNTHLAYAALPGTVRFQVYVGYPADPFNVDIHLDFWRIGGSTTTPEYSTTFSIPKTGSVLDAIVALSLPQLTSGYYRIIATISTKNSCSEYENITETTSTMFVGPGETPCLVWPGDVNNDGIANYGDRAALNAYIYNANMRPTWLQGPARYRADAATNPMALYTWEAQASVPWTTPEGCYMDADGNGTVNNFDLIAVKLNMMRTNGTWIPRTQAGALPLAFGMNQNYPNPFNPSTTLRIDLPEASDVTLTVTDMLGRTVATLVNGRMNAGIHMVHFDGAAQQSGVYVATVRMAGIESGDTFTHSVKMTLNK